MNDDTKQRALDVLRGVEKALYPDSVIVPAGSPIRAVNALLGTERSTTHGIVTITTPDGDVPVVGPVLDKLLESGRVVRREDGTVHGPSRLEVFAWVEELGVCDFCAALHAPHIVAVPDFDMASGRSVGGWAACDDCYALYQANDRETLLQRALAEQGKLLPHGLGKYSTAAIVALHKQFWTAHDEGREAIEATKILNAYIEDQLPDVTTTLTDREKRVELVARLLGVTAKDVKSDSRFAARVAKWRRSFGTNFEQRRVIEELLRAEYQKPLAPGQVPHWERALAARFEALALLQKDLVPDTHAFDQPTDLHDPAAVHNVIAQAERRRELLALDFATDVKMLRMAETYSFNAETIGAIREATTSVPHETPLSSVETPNTGTGWFWFSDPLAIKSSPAAETTVALLWGWAHDVDRNEAVLRFSAFVIGATDDELHGKVLPSTKWSWPLSLSFHDMIGRATLEYRQQYGPGGPFAGDMRSMSERETMTVIAELSLFFLSACVWFNQKIILPAAAHVERHARKRYQREHKLSEPPRVQIVALRAAIREPAPHTEATGEQKTRTYSVRWIVSGHHRLQPVGPGRKERKLIWVQPHPAGPADKPLRTREKVYAVIR